MRPRRALPIVYAAGAIFLALAVYARITVASPWIIATSSMAPGVPKGAIILVAGKVGEGARDLQRGDIVLVKARAAYDGKPFIKRVVGLAGDVVSMEYGRLLINGDFAGYAIIQPGCGRVNLAPGCVTLRETFGNGASHSIYDAPGVGVDVWGPVVVPENAIFLLGDNRDMSLDSRNAARIGFVHREAVVGVLWRVIWPIPISVR